MQTTRRHLRTSPARCGRAATSRPSRPRASAHSGMTAVFNVYPRSAPQALATTELVGTLRNSTLPPIAASTSHNAARRRRKRHADRFHPRSLKQAAAVHRRGRAPLGPAAAHRLPLACHPAAGGVHEPALDRCLPRGRRRDLPVGLAGRHLQCQGRTHPGIHPGDAVRDRVRSFDGLRGLPGLADPRGVDTPPRCRSRPSVTASPRPGG